MDPGRNHFLILISLLLISVISFSNCEDGDGKRVSNRPKYTELRRPTKVKKFHSQATKLLSR